MRSRKKPILFVITLVIVGLLITSTAVSITSQKVLEDASSTVKTFKRALACEITAIEHAITYKLSSSVFRLAESLPNTRAGNHVGRQLLRSGTSPYFNHGEAQAAESVNDFVHKMSICLKELKESYRCLRLVKVVPLTKATSEVDGLISETDELIKIFFASIRTADRRRAKHGKRSNSV